MKNIVAYSRWIGTLTKLRIQIKRLSYQFICITIFHQVHPSTDLGRIGQSSWLRL